MRPDVVVEDGERERDVERDGRRVLSDGAMGLAVLDAEEEGGAEGACRVACGGELAGALLRKAVSTASICWSEDMVLRERRG